MKDNGAWTQQSVRRPAAVAMYNEYMGGVDSFDQLASSYRLLRRSKKSWKCIFYDLIEVATINSFILMKEYKSLHEDTIPRPQGYDQSDFREQLIRQLAEIAIDDPPPVPTNTRKRKHTEADDVPHFPVCDEVRGNCLQCARRQKGLENRSVFQCTVCRNRLGGPAHFCIKAARNCFLDYHQGL